MICLDFDWQIDEFMVYCRASQLRPQTMKSYEQTLRLFERWCLEQMDITTVDKVTESVIRHYIRDIQERGKYTFYAVESQKETNHPDRRRDFRKPVATTSINNYIRNLRVFFLSRHVSLRKACDMVTKERIIDYVIRCTDALRRLGITEGTMAIAGLNPHSGEHGLFGDEEVREVFPAVEELQKMGYHVAGPIGADSVFSQALHGKYNSVLSLYHDQGHIATKTLDFERTISITAGMPILRTSVDHGTAFDIAGKGIASPVSMMEAVRLGVKYAPAFLKE